SQNLNERQQQFAVAIQALVSELATLKAGESSSQPKSIYTVKSKLYVDSRIIGNLEAQFYYLYSSLSLSLFEKLRVNYTESRESISSFLVRFEEEKPKYPNSYSDLCSYLRKLDANTFLGSSTPLNYSAAYNNGAEPIDITATRVNSSGLTKVQRKR
ncbi:hypothetical protein QBC32DRAFT_355595, partial [Pseudoneurospora amorphoporcata]